MNRKAWLALVMVLSLTFPALAQKITVSGTVYEPDGEPAIGASVMVQGLTNVGVSTDIDGFYKIEVAPNATLVFSYVGYTTQTIAVDGRSTIDVHLTTDAVTLQDFVVVGYGAVKKSDATGSVALVKPDDIEAGIATSAQDLLVGASPGVVVTTDGGNPTGGATIRIRGGSSLSANNNPLIVIDGVPQTDQGNAGGTNALTMVNPQNIESMTILKDASATAIYGSRASNGVIIITTKKGQKGRPQVNFAANWHINTARKTLNMMDADQLHAVINEYGTDRAKMMVNQFDVDGKPMYNTNWQKEVLRTSFSHDYSLSVGGSVGFLPYRVNGSYTDNQGIMKTSGMQRATVGFNLSPKFFDDKLTVNANVQGTYIRSQEADMGAIGGAIAMSPTLPVMFDYPMAEGSLAGKSMYNGYYNVTQTTGSPEPNASQNPVQLLKDRKYVGTVYSSTGNLQLDYALHFLPELHVNLNLGYQVSKNSSTTDIAQNSIMAWRSNYKDGAGEHNDWYRLQRNTMLSAYLNYVKDFEAIKSNLNVMAGYEWQHFDYHSRSNTVISTLGYNNDWTKIYNANGYLLQLDPATEAHVGHSYENAPMSIEANNLQLLSFFGRLNYTFDDTYLLTFTLRDDGTSRFSKDNRWGLFPSLALGWKITGMSFMENVRNVVNEAKLRLGWGVTGQQDINSYFPYMPIYTNSYQNGFHYLNPNGDGTWINPLYPNNFNSELKWEETTTWNVGLDLAFLDNRITLAADWYKRDTKDLLAEVPVPGINTCNYMQRNIGTMTNTGVEFTIGAKPVVNKDWIWTTSLNIGYNKNEITELTGDANTTQLPATGIPSGTGGYIQYHIVGKPAFTYMVYEQVYQPNGDPLEGQYVDQNGDGVINDDDLIMFHSPDPKVTMTWNNNVSYKNWDFGIVLRANFGNYVYDNPRFGNSRLYNSAAAQYQVSNLLADSYLFHQGDQQIAASSYFVENASFVRCDNITLGYTFDGLFKDNLNLRVFGAVQNPFVITKYKGLDPEVFGGIDNNCYPRPITVSLGAVLTF
ncbi:MAG: TonB-dependent receptor [Muribaculaceae bacterium]|nr:TonB-dependent receptor [Muribaculaceae bacterium]